MEVKTMGIKEKVLKVLNLSTFCGEGSCGCGCGGPMETKKDLSHEKTQEVLSTEDESLEITGNLSE
jgi:hypothetical protein